MRVENQNINEIINVSEFVQRSLNKDQITMAFFTRLVSSKILIIDFFVAISLSFKVKLIRKRALIGVFFLLFSLQGNVLAKEDVVIQALPPILSLVLDSNPPTNNACTSTAVAGDNPVDGNFTISSQADLDELIGVTRVTRLGFFNLQEELDFTPLDSLVEVTGTLEIAGHLGTSIDGFNCLTTVEQLLISRNPGLISITGFQSLTQATAEIFGSVVSGANSDLSGLSISDNPNLTVIPNFESLRTIEAGLRLIRNEGIVSLSQFPLLESIGGVLNVAQNNSLLSFPEFLSLRSIGGSVSISANLAMTDLTGLPLLTTVGSSFLISSNISLVNITNFDSLTTIIGNGFSGSLAILGNDALPALPAFPVLSNTEDFITISGNDTITDLPEFPMLINVGGSPDTITIERNPNLNDVSGFINLDSGNVRIQNNPQLHSITGFNNMTSVFLALEDNDNLETVSGFRGLDSSFGRSTIFISDNDVLVDLTFLEDITALLSLTIQENLQLEELSGFNNLIEANILTIDRNPNLIEISGFNNLEVEKGNLFIGGNPVLETISGFTRGVTTFGNNVEIEGNEEFDCTGQILNLLPIGFSEGNEVECESIDSEQS